ncbi:carboxynorspermidine decarboxylase [Candidatus Magnetomorum sp. HK-1]|nr:carboxynorspermidine decarboxylase [Candidatus Magnetomorum sp. HK-1]
MENKIKLLTDLKAVETPAFIVNKSSLEKNLKQLEVVKKRTNCKILLALKAFAMYYVFPIIRESLDGVCASSQDEARLGREEFNKEVHSYAAAFSDSEFEAIVRFSDHIVFNSFSQWKRFRPIIENTFNAISCGIRINPEHSEGTVKLYDPCAKGSRLGVRFENFDADEMTGISGFHFHTLCEHNADALERTFSVFEKSFGKYLYDLNWINFGGGHHITRKDYDLDLLCNTINRVKKKYNVDVYLEPGEAVALNAGYLTASVLDIIECDIPVAILDTSAATHMPDVLEMPYRPHIIGSAHKGCKSYSYRLGGMSCLAGDIIGEYSFDYPLKVGEKLIFTDMAHYTMVKTNTFNGIRLPSIFLYDPEKNYMKKIRVFDYNDYKMRLS